MNTERTAWAVPVVLALLAGQLFSFFGLALLLFLPLALVLIAVPPRRTAFIAFGLMLLILGLTRPAPDMLWWVGRGWALILAAWFVGAVALRPGPGFINRGLIAVLGTVCTAALVLAVNGTGWQETDAAVALRFEEQATVFIEEFGARLAGQSWGANTIETLRSWARIQARIFPALLALASLCSLAVVWWLWRRVSVRDLQPLRRLREFRFRHELALPFLIAFVLILLPVGDGVMRTATNVIVFMAPLYILRGFGVLMVLSGFPAGLFDVLGFVMMLLLSPVALPAALVVGVGDTWFDLRATVRPPTQATE